MEKTYEPHLIEQHWYQNWEQEKYFTPSGNGNPYCIVIPPPNVTGSLHMGHGFQLSLMDALVRYHRMCGDNTLWQVGVDHAGIATQMLVEQQLLKEGKTRHDLGREKFVAKIWEWKKVSGDMISKQERRLGISAAWDRERFTLDEGLSKAVQQVFIKLYEEGLIYRGKRLVNWDPVLNTAVSDLEVINEERQGSLWYIRYPLVDKNLNAEIIVATTRPETILGDVAIAVNPTDKRYQNLIGKKVLLPLTDREIPIIADDYADAEFGTGCVKITPAHDFNDYAVGQRHQLPLINIFTPTAHLNENTPEIYRGLDRFAARKKIVTDLENAGLLVKIEPHILKIPKGDRSGAIIEPYLTDQWYVNAKELAKPAIAAVKNGEMKFVPENWDKTYFHWMENIEDWCISRQLWWGHRIPAWYDAQNNIYVGHDEKEIRQKYNLAADIKLTQDNDVLDTWFSSALWPFSTLGWPEQTNELKTFYPTNVLVTGFDIIFFWVARMMMMGLKFTGQVPFHEVYITGLIRDAKGQKMSKSKGNVLDPIDLIDGIGLEDLVKKRTSFLLQANLAKAIEKNTREEFPNGIPASGTDALRFTFCALATTGRDINFEMGRLEGNRNFCNKLWNAARFVLMQTENFVFEKNMHYEYTLADKWIVSELHKTLQIIADNFKTYRFDLLTQAIYNFVWYQYCDWYLELCKPILMTDENSNVSQEIKNGTSKTLLDVLETLLRAIHPIMPFITEEIWQTVAAKLGIQANPNTIMLQKYPEYDAAMLDINAIAEIEWLQKMILAVRNIRGEMNIPPKKPLQLLLSKGSTKDKEYLTRHKMYFASLAKLENIDWLDENAKKPFSATALVENLELYIVLENIIDKNAEIARLEKEIGKLQKEIDRIEGKLNNAGYVAKAPAELVNNEKIKSQEFKNALEKLTKKIAEIKS